MAPAEALEAADVAALLSVTVAYSPRAGVVDEVGVRLAPGATLRDALRASGLLERHPQIDLEVQRVGVWGRLKTLDTTLRERDRVEVYRGLRVDPKEARRQRYRRHRERVKTG
jgi:putative ubiquitin-RnfH superfamily antitoxin RatB of RatAB toxin-antitoxin module